MKSSKRGSSILKVVKHEVCPEQLMNGESTKNFLKSSTETSLKAATSTMAQSQPAGFIYGWKPDHALAQISYRPYESWLIYQAQSILQKQEVTLEEAKDLFKEIDISTRKPVEAPRATRPAGIFAALRAWVSGGIILLMASGCAKYTNNDPEYTMVSFNAGVRKVYDRDEGVVCYVSSEGGISCMVAKPGDNQ